MTPEIPIESVIKLGGVLYRRDNPSSRVWRAQDGSKNVITGPEEMEEMEENYIDWPYKYMYVSKRMDYFRIEPKLMFNKSRKQLRKRREQLRYVSIDISQTGFIEHILTDFDKPLETLRGFSFECKKLAELETGKTNTLLEQIKWFKENPSEELFSCFENERRVRLSKIIRAYPNEANLSDDETRNSEICPRIRDYLNGGPEDDDGDTTWPIRMPMASLLG